MTQSPWSVKGIDPKARSAARERASERGVTLGQYLNSLLLDENEPARVDEIRLGAVNAGEAAPDEMRRMSAEIDLLTQRLETSQARSSRAIAGIDKSIVSLLGKVDTSNRAQLQALERITRAMTDIEATQTALRTRIDTLESSGGGQTADALRTLEGSLARLAKVVSDRSGEMERDHAGLREHVDRKVSDVAERVDSQVSAAERRMERAIETASARARTQAQDLVSRVDAMEAGARDSVGALGDTVSRITERLNRAERKSETVASVLEKSINELDERLATLNAGPAADEIQRIQTAFQTRIETLTEELSRPVQTLRADMERRIDEALRSHQPDRADRLERTMRQLQDRIEESELRQAGAVDTMSAQIERMIRAVDERLRAVEARGDDRSIDDVRREMMRLADNIEARLGGAESASRVSAGAIDALRQDVGRLNSAIDSRIEASERRSAGAIEAVGEQVALVAERLQRRHDEAMQRLSGRVDEAHAGGEASLDEFRRVADRFDERIRDSERRSAEAIGQIGEQVARVADRLQTQQQESLRHIEARLDESTRTHETRLNEALTDMTRRLDEVGDHSAALNPIHKRVSSIARRLAEMEDGGIPPLPADRATAAPAATDDIFVLDDAPIAEPISLFQETEDEVASVIGVEPPPFDRTSESQLFAEDAIFPETAPAPAETRAASDIEDLLDADDMLLAPPPHADDFLAEAPPVERPERATNDYISEVRRAASQGRRVPLVAAPAATRRGVGRGPLVASAALALAVAGGSAWTVMRGKQETANDPFAKMEPSAPAVAAGDPAAAEAALFGDGEAATAPAAAEDIFEPTPLTTLGAVETIEPAVTLAQAVENGDPVALHDQAVELLQTPEKARAVRMMKEAASKGLVMAQYRLAKLYEKGEGAPRDMAASRSWTEQAAIGGNVKAMHDLAVFYAEGDSGPQSYAAAVEWFRQAADLGLLDSQYNLAVLYEQGLGVSEDAGEAAYWFEIAGRAGDSDAARRARELLAGLPSAEAEQIKRRARSFNPKPVIARANGEFGKRPWDAPSSAQIMEAQRLLERLGYTPGPADGKPGGRTAEAIRAFEKDKGLPLTGEANAALLRQLHAATLNGG
jgi:localization factor PodJL